MIKIATRGGAIIINQKRIQRALKIKLHLSKLLKYFGSFLFISSYSWFCVFVCLVNELRACSCVLQCDVSSRARVCVCRLLDIPQGTPALSGDLMWLMSGLIITTTPHHPHTSAAAAAACLAQTPSAVSPHSRGYFTFALCFVFVTLITDELFACFSPNTFRAPSGALASSWVEISRGRLCFIETLFLQPVAADSFQKKCPRCFIVHPELILI